jgi:general secretion pathway protein D
MTPTIHANRDVTLKMSVEVSSQSTPETIAGVQEPVINQQKADEVIRIRDGESSILAGLVKRQENKTVSGWPGFGEIPLLKYLFTTQSHEVLNDELVFLIVPHVVRAPVSDAGAGQIDTGTERAIELRGPEL